MSRYPKTRFPEEGAQIRLAMIGMIPGNGHPYSWSTIINGYIETELRKCPYPVIANYMQVQGELSSGLPEVEVTHIWTDEPEDAYKVAAAARIGHVIESPEQAIGQVDAVIIATDDGDNHVRRALPFIEAGLPLFIDKPLATNVKDLSCFVGLEREGNFFMSSSGLRYAPELDELKARMRQIGEPRLFSSVGIKKWETYGIHALESVYQLTGPGFYSVRVETLDSGVVANLQHRKGFMVTLPILEDGFGSFGAMQICGTKGQIALQLKDTYTAFRHQLEAFVSSIRNRRPAVPFVQTIELMTILIAGRMSMENRGRAVHLDEINQELI